MPLPVVTSRCHLDPFRRQSRIVANRDKHPDVNQRAGSSRIESQLDNGARTRTPEFRSYDNQPSPRIKNEIHNMIAVSCGILPV